MMKDGRFVEAICVDAACSSNPGMMEYRGVHIPSGKEVFRFGPIYGTNNIGEFLAIVHGLALMKRRGITLPLYSDSYTARSWVREKRCYTGLERNEKSEKAYQMIERAERWLKTNNYPNKVETWLTREWGEIPADFGRKNKYYH